MKMKTFIGPWSFREGIPFLLFVDKKGKPPLQSQKTRYDLRYDGSLFVGNSLRSILKSLFLLTDKVRNSTYSFLIIMPRLHREAGRSLVCSQNRTPCEPVSLYTENVLLYYLKALPPFHPFLLTSWRSKGNKIITT